MAKIQKHLKQKYFSNKFQFGNKSPPPPAIWLEKNPGWMIWLQLGLLPNFDWDLYFFLIFGSIKKNINILEIYVSFCLLVKYS